MTHENKYHRDGTTTVWNVYNQVWERRTDESIFNDDKLMARMNDHECARIEARAHGMTLTQARALANYIGRCADEGGTIPPEKMVDIAGAARPEMHTHMLVDTVLYELGCWYSSQIHYT